MLQSSQTFFAWNENVVLQNDEGMQSVTLVNYGTEKGNLVLVPQVRVDPCMQARDTCI